MELYQMTKAQYEARFGKPRRNTTLTRGFSAHKSAIEIAINQGKDIPQEVLADYPELCPKYVILIEKTCGCCGKKYTEVPAAHVLNELFYWWDCSCGSTLVVEPQFVEVRYA